MNCNTTHYRANSSSVPGDPTPNRDEFWTDEVQGVAWDGTNLIFSTNARQSKPDSRNKALYVFPGGSQLRDGWWIQQIVYKDIPHPYAAVDQSWHHWGQVTYHDSHVYVSHFWEEGPRKNESSVVVFKRDGGRLRFDRWVELEPATSPTDGRSGNVEFQAINPWDEPAMFYTCFGGDGVHEFFLHDMAGRFTRRTFRLSRPLNKVQGACFSANGHLYIASNQKHPAGAKYQSIYYCSALNGHVYGAIPVLAEAAEDTEDVGSSEELEGLCCIGGRIYAVLLDNISLALDDIFFKTFAAKDPSLV